MAVGKAHCLPRMEKVTCVCVSVEVVRTKKTSWSFSFFFRSEHWLKLPFLTCIREKRKYFRSDGFLLLILLGQLV